MQCDDVTLIDWNMIPPYARPNRLFINSNFILSICPALTRPLHKHTHNDKSISIRDGNYFIRTRRT